MPVQIKRAYEPAAAGDGYRVLVDRLWPRGVNKDEAQLDAWYRDLAPSTELRRWYGHKTERWDEFRDKYRAELAAEKPLTLLQEIAERGRQGPVTLVFGARDAEHSQAEVLRELLLEGVPRAPGSNGAAPQA